MSNAAWRVMWGQGAQVGQTSFDGISRHGSTTAHGVGKSQAFDWRGPLFCGMPGTFVLYWTVKKLESCQCTSDALHFVRDKDINVNHASESSTRRTFGVSCQDARIVYRL